MLSPALFYALGFALVFFGVLRLVYLGLKGTPAAPRPSAGTGEGDEEEAGPEPRRGFGLVGLMGGGRMSGPKRHKVMGVLWIIMGLYVAWTGFNMSRSERVARSDASDEGVRVIRANVKTPAPEGNGTDKAPTLRAAPEAAGTP